MELGFWIVFGQTHKKTCTGARVIAQQSLKYFSTYLLYFLRQLPYRKWWDRCKVIIMRCTKRRGNLYLYTRVTSFNCAFFRFGCRLFFQNVETDCQFIIFVVCCTILPHTVSYVTCSGHLKWSSVHLTVKIKLVKYIVHLKTPSTWLLGYQDLLKFA